MTRLILMLIGIVGFVGQAPAGTLDSIAVTKIIHIGFIDGQAPFAVKNTNGAAAGYAIDLCDDIAGSLRQSIPGLQVIKVETNLTDAFHDIIIGKIDLLCGAVTATLSRRELVDFSQPIFITGMSALLRQDSPADIRDLVTDDRQISPPRSLMMRAFANHIFGVRAGSTTAATLRRVVKQDLDGASIIEYDTHEAGLAALRQRQIDAYFADRGLLIGLLQDKADTGGLIIADRWFTHEPYAIALPRGDSAFRLAVDRALTEFYESPDFMPLLRRYFADNATTVAEAVLMQSLPK